MGRVWVIYKIRLLRCTYILYCKNVYVEKSNIYPAPERRMTFFEDYNFQGRDSEDGTALLSPRSSKAVLGAAKAPVRKFTNEVWAHERGRRRSEATTIRW
jgi:hypothetical protein